MSETMVERVARAIDPGAWGKPGVGMAAFQEPRRDTARRTARAAIEAMREPTVEMPHAGIEGYWFEAPALEVVQGASTMSGIGMRQAWRAMIDAALSEGQEP